jgi:hypothetical protein
MVGGICLIVGMVIAQASSLNRNQAPTFALANASVLPDDDVRTISAVVDISSQPTPLAADFTESTPSASIPGASELDSRLQTKPSAPPIEKAIAVVDDEVVSKSKSTEPNTSFIEEPHKHSLISQHSTSKQQITEKVNPAAALEAIVAAQNSMKSLPTLGVQSTILPPSQCQDGTCQESTRSLGTVLNWADTPADAYRRAGETEKLVFLIHVSGNFEIPGFT